MPASRSAVTTCDAAHRMIAGGAADTLGIRGLITHAISEDAKRFYQAVGFDASPTEPMTLMITLSDLRKTLADS